MRLLKIKISCFDRKVAEFFGDDPEMDIPGECVIDLDKVTSVWKNPSGELCVHLLGTESYLTGSYGLEEFIQLWQNKDKII